MTADAESRDEVRWAQLLEAEACDELSADDRSELDRLTASNEERRQVRLVLAAIAAPGTIQDDLTNEDRGLIDSVLAEHAQRGRKRRRMVGLAAVVVAAPLAAAAAYLPWGEQAHEAPNSTTLPKEPSIVPSVASAHRSPGELDDREPTAKPESASEPSGSSAAPSATPARPSAAELLARAQKARSARRYGAAIGTYQQLLRLYPRSGEARLAQVSLAQLQLAQGNAVAALKGFDAYQQTGGALSQEAHYGKIQALRALGRSAEERAEIRSFLARYPKSLQAATLRRRLGANGDQD